MKQKILILGCSYTSPYNPTVEPECYSHQKWPDFLAKKIKCNSYQNLALSGGGSSFIQYTTTKHLIQSNDVNNIRCVIVAWPSANREDVKLYKRFGKNPSAQWKNSILRSDMFEYIEHRWIEQSLVDMWSVYSLCGFYNVPYIGFQMGPFYGYLFVDETNPHVLDLNKVPRPRLEEYDVYKKLVSNNHLSNNLNLCLYNELNLYRYMYNDNDSHFNEDGHKLVSEWVYDEIQRLGY